MTEYERHHPGDITGDDNAKSKESGEAPEEAVGAEPQPKQAPKTPELTVTDLRRIVSPEYLKAIAQASGGFSFVIDSRMGPGDPMGSTDMKTRVIRLNPHKIQKLSSEAIEGLLTHEAGHHAPPVAQLDHKMVDALDKKDILPEELTEDPKIQAEIIRAINGHLCNALLDCWDESFMGRRPHFVTRDRIKSLYTGTHEGRKQVDLKKLPKPDQLCQVLVGEDRYPREGVEIKELVDPDVYAVYLKLKESGAIDAMNTARAFEDYFAREAQHDASVDRKFSAFIDAFLPAWLELYEAETEERKEQARGAGGGAGEGGELTPEQIQQILEALAKELQKLGQQYGSKAPSPEQKEGIGKVVAKILAGEKPTQEKPEGKPEDNIASSAAEMLREWNEMRRRGMAEGSGVRIESVRTWEEIKKERQEEIETAAAQIADVFLEDRRKRLEYMRREGEIVPGLEYEYVAAVVSGDATPQTHMRQVQNPEFLETEVEFIQDVSGSMSGEPIRKCIELQIILAEAFRKVRQSLADEQLLNPSEEEPLRIGATKFETSATRVKKLHERMDDEMEMKIVDELTKGGGGTDEEQALTEVYGELTMHQKHVLKIMVILSDGHGNKEAVARIMQQIEDDDEVVVAAVGLGSAANAVVEAYTAGLRKGDQSNVHPFETEDPKDLLPSLLEFFRVEVGKRRRF